MPAAQCAQLFRVCSFLCIYLLVLLVLITSLRREEKKERNTQKNKERTAVQTVRDMGRDHAVPCHSTQATKSLSNNVQNHSQTLATGAVQTCTRLPKCPASGRTQRQLQSFMTL